MPGFFHTTGNRTTALFTMLLVAAASPCIAADGALYGSYFEFGGGLGDYGLETLNKDFIGRVGAITDVFEEETGSGPEFFLNAGYFVAPNLSVSGGVSFLRTSTKHRGTFEFIDIYDNLVVEDIDSEMSVSLFALEVKSRLYVPMGRVRLFAGGTVAWCHGKVDMDVSIGDNASEDEIFTGNGFGFGLLAGFSTRISGPFSLTLEGGYRHYGTGTLTDSDGDDWNLDILDGDPGVDLDFNGFYGVLGVTLDIGLP